MAQAYVPSGHYVEGAGDFFDRLDRAGLPEAVRAQIRDTLHVLLEDDGETVVPDRAAFGAFVAFLSEHRDVPAPSMGVNRNGLVVARWREPAFQLSLEFRGPGEIHWLMTEFRGGNPTTRDGWASPDQAPLPRRRQRELA